MDNWKIEKEKHEKNLHKNWKTSTKFSDKSHVPKNSPINENDTSTLRTFEGGSMISAEIPNEIQKNLF